MGNNLSPYSIAVGDENICFLTPHFNFIKEDKIVESEFLNINESSVDPFDYHISNCGKDSLKKLRIYNFHQIMIRTITQHIRLYVLRHTHYMTQPKDYNWLPKCFGNINILFQRK